MSNPTLSGRTWGDGADRKAEHIIDDISYEKGSIACSCGSFVGIRLGLTLEDAWDTHRGKPELVLDRALTPSHEAQASNDEVSAFLELVRNPVYEFIPEERA